MRRVLVVILLLASSWVCPKRAIAREAGTVTAESATMSLPQAARSVARVLPLEGGPGTGAALEHVHRRGPLTIKSSGGQLGALAEAPRAPETDAPPFVSAPEDAGTFTFFKATNLGGALPSGNTSFIGEPCVANSGADIFMTGNWYAAVSSDDGRSFAYVSPFTMFPSVNRGFCCDQRVAYDSAHDLFIWTLMYIEDGNTNTLRIALARGKAGVEAGQWYYYDFNPQQVGMPPGFGFDYPQLALGTNSLYATANIFATGDGPFSSSVVLRIPLAALASGQGFTFSYLRASDHSTFTPVSGAATTIYWASHDPLFFRTRIYRWPEGTGTISFDDVDVNAYGVGNASCPDPDARNWCG